MDGRSKVHGPQIGRILVELDNFTVQFSFVGPSTLIQDHFQNFESFLTRSRSRFLDRPNSEFNILKSLSNFGLIFLSDQFADQSEPERSFSAKRTENGSISESRIFSKIRSLGSKDSRLSQSESSSSSAKRELGREVPRRSQRLRSSVSENDRQIFERSRFDLGIDLTVTIFIKSIVVQNDISDR